MPSAGPARPELTPAQLAAVGRLWDHGHAFENEALAWLGARYSVEGCENFALLRWDQLGSALQQQIAHAWYALLDRWHKAVR